MTDAILHAMAREWCPDGVFATATYRDIATWDVRRVTDMTSLFDDCATFDEDVGAWDTSNVRSFKHMFRNAAAFSPRRLAWDTGMAVNMAVR